VLVQGAQYAYNVLPGQFILTGQPLQGINPPPPVKRAPLRPDVACETQQQPDLRTKVGSPPPGRKIEMPDTPEAQKRYAEAQAYAVKWLKDRIKTEGVANQLKVDDTPLTAERLNEIKGRIGTLGNFKVTDEEKGK
jgi:hypothetical protein